MVKFVCVFLYVSLGVACCIEIQDQNYPLAAAYAFGTFFSLGMIMVEELRRRP